MENQNNEKTSALKKLAVFAGTWSGTGEFLEGAGPGQGARLKTGAECTWLAGGFFLLHDSSLDFGAGKLTAHRVIGYDSAAGHYVINAFDSLGFTRECRGTVAGDVWTFRGEHERATFTFSEAGTSLETFWENSPKGGEWMPLCRTLETKSTVH